MKAKDFYLYGCAEGVITQDSVLRAAEEVLTHLSDYVKADVSHWCIDSAEGDELLLSFWTISGPSEQEDLSLTISTQPYQEEGTSEDEAA